MLWEELDNNRPQISEHKCSITLVPTICEEGKLMKSDN